MTDQVIDCRIDSRVGCCEALNRMNPAKVQDFYRIEYILKVNPANIQEVYTFTFKEGSSAHKSCINAGFLDKRNKIGKNDVLLHHYWIGNVAMCMSELIGSIKVQNIAAYYCSHLYQK